MNRTEQTSSAEELLNILNVFAVRQTRAHQAPLLVFENINEMYPSSLRVVCRLASLSANNLFAFRIVLTSNSDFRRIINSPSMSAVARRMTGDFELEPLTSNEAKNYLYAKLRSCGVERPDDVFPVDTCDKIYSASGGLPGQLDDIALSIIETSTVKLSTADESADDLPVLVEEFDYPELHVDDESPRLVVTSGGRTLQDIILVDTRALIGRAELCDIIISDPFISKQHALLIREQNVVILVDLKSVNGTYVNSRRVQRTVLRDNDIISVGDHRIKMLFANCQTPSEIDSMYLGDTAKMKSVADARREKLKKAAPIDEALAGRPPVTPRRK